MHQKLAHLDPAYRTALAICAILNVAMLLIEGTVGVWIGSAALLADAGDFLGAVSRSTYIPTKPPGEDRILHGCPSTTN
jgi:Co/Zn/Cd efflux system component